MRRALLGIIWLAALLPTYVGAQEAAPEVTGPWWWRMLVFVVSLPYTLYMVFVDGQQMHLLPAPLLAAALCFWSFREWRRQKFWTPRIIHLLAVLGLATIVMINIAWVQAGGEMWMQRYVVIAVFGLFPYVAYLVFLGPKFLGRRREIPEAQPGMSFDVSAGGPAGAADDDADGAADMTFERVGRARVGTLRRGASYALLGGLLGVAAVGAFVSAATGRSASVSRPELGALMNPDSLVPMAGGIAKGDPAAPITIIVFGDYQCPGCGRFARTSQPQIDSAFVETGRARFVFIELPLVSIHANAFLAARAGRCAADQDGFWKYQDELYRRQAEWSSMTDPSDAFEKGAQAVGLDGVSFRTCLDSDRHADVIAANQELARRFGIRSTPTTLIGHRSGEVRELHRDSYRSVVRAIGEVEGGGPAD